MSIAIADWSVPVEFTAVRADRVVTIAGTITGRIPGRDLFDVLIDGGTAVEINVPGERIRVRADA